MGRVNPPAFIVEFVKSIQEILKFPEDLSNFDLSEKV